MHRSSASPAETPADVAPADLTPRRPRIGRRAVAGAAALSSLVLAAAIGAVALPSFADTAHAVVLAERRPLSPQWVGYNADSNLAAKGDPWNDKALRSTFSSLKPGNLRYPDGSPANYWNCQTGAPDTKLDWSSFQLPWWMPGYLQGVKGHTLDNLKIGMKASKSGVTFVLNTVTDNVGARVATPDYQIGCLKRWRDQLGMPVQRVELGNELYACWEESLICSWNSGVNKGAYRPKYQQESTYAAQMKTWIAKIRSALGPKVQIALDAAIGAAPGTREATWNTDLADNRSSLFGPGLADAVTMHYYYDTRGKSPATTPLKQFLTDGLDSWHAALKQSLDGQLTRLADKEIWVTEFNLDPYGTGKYFDTEDQMLWLSLQLTEMLKTRQINLIDYHGAYGGHYGAIDDQNRITHPGAVMQLFGQAMTGMTTAERYTVKGTTYLDAKKKYEALNAWAFTDGTRRSAVLTNLGDTKQTIDPAGFKLCDHTYRTITGTNLTGKTGSAGTALALPPHSITILGTGGPCGSGARPATSAASAPAPKPTGTAAGEHLTVDYRNGPDHTANDSVIRGMVTVTNRGPAPVRMADLALRYYYTDETGQPQLFDCLSAAVGCADVRMTTHRTKGRGADTYAEFTFTGGRVLQPGQDSGPLMFQIHSRDWHNFTETGDYSFDARTTFAPTSKITVFDHGRQVAGTAP